MVDLWGSLPTDATNPDEATPDVIDMELLRECTKGDEAFVEEIQDSLRPLYVLLGTPAVLLTLRLVLGSDVMNGPGGTASLTSTGAGSLSSMEWWMPTSVGSIRMTFIRTSLRLILAKHKVHPRPHPNPYNPHSPRVIRQLQPPLS